MLTINLKAAGLALAAALATSAATLFATGAPAVAATPIVVVEAAPVPTVRVAHNDLNLRTAAGVRKLQARVRRAAEQLCLDPHSKSLQVLAEGKTCLKVAIEQASPQVDRAIGIQSAQIGAGGK